MKVTRIEGHGTYEYFQRYSHDPYLGTNNTTDSFQAIQPEYETSPIGAGRTWADFFADEFSPLRKLLPPYDENID